MSGEKWREFWIGPSNDDDENDIDALFDVMGVEQRPVWDEAPQGISIPVIEKAALEEKDLVIRELQMVCRRLAAAKSLETRDKIAKQCHHLFAGSPLREAQQRGE